MKLLFDQNLSPRLPRLLADIFPDSAHVRELGMRDATDTKIWEYAKAIGFAIVSKDSDFQARSLLLGHPPKFIWLRVGNCPVKTIEVLLVNKIPLQVRTGLAIHPIHQWKSQQKRKKSSRYE